ncbi:MAG: hypothetical protein L6E13_05645 [Firmicutes bacterium]|nr:hypothetical protein [Bacillota bacterium]
MTHRPPDPLPTLPPAAAAPTPHPGPAPQDRAQRLALAEAIARRCQEIWGERLLALGLYGSLARGATPRTCCWPGPPGWTSGGPWSRGPTAR